MTAQPKFSAKQQADYAFRKQYCLHKVWIAFPDGETCTHYANDCSNTYLQMWAGHTPRVSLSYSKGLEDCIKKEKYFRKKRPYRTCIIYRRTVVDGKVVWAELHKYVEGNLVEQSIEQLKEDLRHYQVSIENNEVKLQPLKRISPCK